MPENMLYVICNDKCVLEEKLGFCVSHFKCYHLGNQERRTATRLALPSETLLQNKTK